MDPIQVLHNAARHYCMEQSARWHRQYADLAAARGERTAVRAGSWSFTDAAYDIFPRYQVLNAIQSDVERFVPGDFQSADEMRWLLIAAAETAQNVFTKFENPVAVRAADDERRRFAEFIRFVDAGQLNTLPLLPFRRILGEIEHRKLHQAFTFRWGKWYGGSVDSADAGADAVTLHTAAMANPKAYDDLRQLVAAHGISRLFELREWGDGCELDTANAGFTYNGAEGFWTSNGMAWMVYASHESSITFGGLWLAEGMRGFLPLFQRYLYRGWDLAAYPDYPNNDSARG